MSLHISQLSKTFGKGETEVRALQNVDLDVQDGELVALVGPSGSGKSTLLSIAGALMSPTDGAISLDDRDFQDLSEAERTNLRREEIGFIFQGSNLVSFLTGRDQLEFMGTLLSISKDESKQRAERLLDGLGMSKRADHYPTEMSGGERQRIAIGRALMNEPKLILADEPTASLDTERGRQVVELLRDEVHERNVAGILVTHDERLLDLCDRVVRIHDGKLDEEDAPSASRGARSARQPV